MSGSPDRLLPAACIYGPFCGGTDPASGSTITHDTSLGNGVEAHCTWRCRIGRRARGSDKEAISSPCNKWSLFVGDHRFTMNGEIDEDQGVWCLVTRKTGFMFRFRNSDSKISGCAETLCVFGHPPPLLSAWWCYSLARRMALTPASSIIHPDYCML